MEASRKPSDQEEVQDTESSVEESVHPDLSFFPRNADFVGVEELRKHLSDKIKALKTNGQVTYITKRGKPEVVMMSFEKLGQMVERIEDLEDSLTIAETKMLDKSEFITLDELEDSLKDGDS